MQNFCRMRRVIVRLIDGSREGQDIFVVRLGVDQRLKGCQCVVRMIGIPLCKREVIAGGLLERINGQYLAENVYRFFVAIEHGQTGTVFR